MEIGHNWQQRRTMDLLELGWHCPASSKQGNYPGEEAVETPHWDVEPERQPFSSKREETYQNGQCLRKGGTGPFGSDLIGYGPGKAPLRGCIGLYLIL